MQRIIILGAGFAGLKLAKELSNNPHYDILLFDKYNHHQFQPLFYQVATAGLDASNISFPLRKIFQDTPNVNIRLAVVQAIDTKNNNITTNIGKFDFDYLVIATGADTNFFGNVQMAANALPMKSTVEALKLRNHLLLNFEKALAVNDTIARQAFMNICIVGGGPTGVELSGAIAEMKKYILPKDFPELDFKCMNIFLFEGSATTLEVMSEKSQHQSMEYLTDLGVTIKSNTKVVSYDGEYLTTNSGEVIATKTVIWAAGVRGNVPSGIDPNLIGRGNRILVDSTCAVNGYEHIFAFGDIALMQTPESPNGHPQVAPVAQQQAAMVAHNFVQRTKKHFSLDTFSYNDKGSMATVGSK